MSLTNFTQVIDGSSFRFGKLVRCNFDQEITTTTVNGNPAIKFTNMPGVEDGDDRLYVFRNRDTGVILSAQAIAADVSGDIEVDIEIGTADVIRGGGGAITVTGNERFNVAIYEPPIYLGITKLTANQEYEYATLLNENNNKCRDDIIKRTMSLSGAIVNMEFENIQRVLAMNAQGADDLHLIDREPLVNGIVILDDARTFPEVGETTFEYIMRCFNCQFKPNGELLINKRDRKELPFMVDINFDEVARAWCQYARVAI